MICRSIGRDTSQLGGRHPTTMMGAMPVRPMDAVLMASYAPRGREGLCATGQTCKTALAA